MMDGIVKRVAVAVAVLLLALLGVAACGDDASRLQDAAPAASEIGSAVEYPFDLEEGVGVELKLHSTVEISESGAENHTRAIQVVTTMEFRCTEVTAAGHRVARLQMGQFDVDGAPKDAGKLDGLGGSMTIGADRRARSVELGGHELAGKRPFSNPFVTGGLSLYMPLAQGKMRIGDTVHMPPELPENTLPPLVQLAVEQSSVPPRFRGSYTLSETRHVEGVRVGAFDIDISLTFSGKASTEVGELEVVIDMTCTGTQSFALSTGLPVGTGEARVLQRMEIKGELGDSTMLAKADIRADCRPLR